MRMVENDVLKFVSHVLIEFSGINIVNDCVSGRFKFVEILFRVDVRSKQFLA